MKVSESCPTLCDPLDCSLPGSSAHGIFKARVLDRVAIAFSIMSYRYKQRNRRKTLCVWWSLRLYSFNDLHIQHISVSIVYITTYITSPVFVILYLEVCKNFDWLHLIPHPHPLPLPLPMITTYWPLFLWFCLDVCVWSIMDLHYVSVSVHVQSMVCVKH